MEFDVRWCGDHLEAEPAVGDDTAGPITDDIERTRQLIYLERERYILGIDLPRESLSGQ